MSTFIFSAMRPALASAVFFMVLTGIAYPLATMGVGYVLFPFQAQGSLVEQDGRVLGSKLIGQHFSRPGYFHGRPSATLGADPSAPGQWVAQPYNAAASGASNQGVLSKSLLDAVAQRAQAYRAANGLAEQVRVPVDAVTASASGLDPHISVANARLQAPRVAQARGLALEQVLQLVAAHTQERQWGVLGDHRVAVLELNLALDRAASQQPAGR